jgi:hypothetical protein
MAPSPCPVLLYSSCPWSTIQCTVVLKEGSGDIRELEWVINRKTQVPMVKLPENEESWFRFWVGETQGTRRDPERFWFPKNHCFRLHAHDSMLKLPANDKSGLRFWVGGTQDTRRDPVRFWAPKNHCFRLYAHVSMVKLPENVESWFIFWVGGTQVTRRDPERFLSPKKPLF